MPDTEPTPAPIPDGIVRAVLEGTHGGEPWSIGHWLQIDGSPSGSELNDLANGLYTAFDDNLLDPLSENLTLTHAKVTWFNAGGEFEGNHFASEPGTASADELTNQVALVLTWLIASHYRGGKPRSYLPGITMDKLATPRSYTDDFVAAYSGLAQDYIDDIAALSISGISSVTIGVLHRWRNFNALDPPDFEAFTGAKAQKRVCTQRRRLGAEF